MSTGHLSIAVVFSGSTETPSLEITCPRYYTDDTLNAHFFFLFLNDVFKVN